MTKTKKHPFVAAMINFEYNGISRMVEPRDCHDAKKLENWWFKNRDKTDSSLLAEFEEIQKISSRLLVKYTTWELVHKNNFSQLKTHKK